MRFWHVYIVFSLICALPVSGIMIDPSYKAPIPNARLQTPLPASTQTRPLFPKWQTEAKKNLSDPASSYGGTGNCGAKSIEKYFFSNPREQQNTQASKNYRQLNALFSSCLP